MVAYLIALWGHPVKAQGGGEDLDTPIIVVVPEQTSEEPTMGAMNGDLQTSGTTKSMFHEGFLHGGISFGAGAFSSSFAGDTAPQWGPVTFSGALKLGKYIFPGFVLGGEMSFSAALQTYTARKVDENSGEVTLQEENYDDLLLNVDVVGTYYLFPDKGLYTKAGLGFATRRFTYSDSAKQNSYGMSFRLGAGSEWQIFSKIYVGVEMAYNPAVMLSGKKRGVNEFAPEKNFVVHQVLGLVSLTMH